MTHNQHPFGHATKYGSRSEPQAFGTADELLFFSGISARDPDLTIELLDTESYHMLLVKCPMICGCIRTYWTIIYICIFMHMYIYMHTHTRFPQTFDTEPHMISTPSKTNICFKLSRACFRSCRIDFQIAEIAAGLYGNL